MRTFWGGIIVLALLVCPALALAGVFGQESELTNPFLAAADTEPAAYDLSAGSRAINWAGYDWVVSSSPLKEHDGNQVQFSTWNPPFLGDPYSL